jgi:hypothetical protein
MLNRQKKKIMKRFRDISKTLNMVIILFITGCANHSIPVIYINLDATRIEELAAREIRKYFYLRTGELLKVRPWDESLVIKGNSILVGSVQSGLMKSTGYSISDLGHDDFILKTIHSSSGKKLLICGGSDISTLYAAYHLAEQLGIGFYLDGDVIPDRKIQFVFPELDIKQTPLFSNRGIQPFHDFPEGPDWWNKEDYKAVFSQLPKLKMNFFGLHTYPEGGVGPEPLTWIGLTEDINPDGSVRSAYHSRHFTTLNGTWGYLPKKASEYSFGAGQLLDRDDFGADYMKERSPWPKPDDEANLFNDEGKFLNEVFTFAEHLGIQTCIGTEVPLVLPNQFVKRLSEKGLNPSLPDVRQKIYEGIFERIRKTHPLNFYWFWTPEDWTWKGNNKEDVDETIRDLNAAKRALEVVKPGFVLATCGWVLGPKDDRTWFDKYLPKDIAFSCINRNLGWETIDTAFVRISGREKWAIPWMEDDPGLSMPQLWVGRMRRDASDAYAYGCTGYFGIHWRTREISMNVSALAKAAWDQPWIHVKATKISVPQLHQYFIKMEGPDRKKRDMECLDFYEKWCKTEFGDEIAEKAARIFASVDGVKEKTINLQSDLSNLPRPADWINGPGGIHLNSHPWDSIKAKYNFIREFERLRPSVTGKGNMERFNYWLNEFKYLEASGMLSCLMGEFDIESKKLSKLTETEKVALIREKLIPLVRKEVFQLTEIHKFLISAVSNWGGIGNVTNWQQHIIPGQIMPQIRQIVQMTGDSLWVQKLFPENIPEVARIIVPSPQTMIEKGTDYKVKVICFNINPQKAIIYWRSLGEKNFSRADLKKISATHWIATIPSEKIPDDFEYYIKIQDNKDYIYPITSPQSNQTVVLLN